MSHRTLVPVIASAFVVLTVSALMPSDDLCRMIPSRSDTRALTRKLQLES